MIAIMIENGQVIPPTGPLATPIHLGSVCFDSKAAETQMNVPLCYDSISRSQCHFPSLYGPRPPVVFLGLVFCPGRPPSPLPREDLRCSGTRLDDPWCAGEARPRRWRVNIKGKSNAQPKWEFYDLTRGSYFFLTCHSFSLCKVKDLNLKMTGNVRIPPRVRDLMLTEHRSGDRRLMSVSRRSKQGRWNRRGHFLSRHFESDAERDPYFYIQKPNIAREGTRDVCVFPVESRCWGGT